MTPKEMLEMRMNGASFQEIADICGETRQGVREAIKSYAAELTSVKRGGFSDIGKIKYKGLREYFAKNENESFNTFSRKLYKYPGAYLQKIRREFIGEAETHFTIRDIKAICAVVGKPFEEVFEECDEVASKT